LFSGREVLAHLFRGGGGEKGKSFGEARWSVGVTVAKKGKNLISHWREKKKEKKKFHRKGKDLRGHQVTVSDTRGGIFW